MAVCSWWWCVVSAVCASVVMAQIQGLDDLFDGPPLDGDLDKISGFWYQIAEFETNSYDSISCSDIVLNRNDIIHLDQVCQETSKYKIAKIDGDKFKIDENGHIIEFKTSQDWSVLGIYRKTTTDFSDSIKIYGRNLNKTEYFSQLGQYLSKFSSKRCIRQKIDCLLKIKHKLYQHAHNQTSSHRIRKRFRREKDTRGSESMKTDNHTMLSEYGDYSDGVTIQKINNTEYIVYDDVFIPLETNSPKTDKIQNNGSEKTFVEENSKHEQINQLNGKELADDPNNPSVIHQNLSIRERHSSNSSINYVENLVLVKKINTAVSENDIDNVTPSIDQNHDYKPPITGPYSPSIADTNNETSNANLANDYTNISTSIVVPDPWISNSDLLNKNAFQAINDLNFTNNQTLTNLTIYNTDTEDTTTFLNENYLDINISSNYSIDPSDDVRDKSTDISDTKESNLISNVTTPSYKLITEWGNKNNLQTPNYNSTDDSYNLNFTSINNSTSGQSYSSIALDIDYFSQGNTTQSIKNLELDTENETTTESWSIRFWNVTNITYTNEISEKLNLTFPAESNTSENYNNINTTELGNNSSLDGENFTHGQSIDNNTLLTPQKSEVTTEGQLQTNDNTITITHSPPDINNTYVNQSNLSTERNTLAPLITRDNMTSINRTDSITTIIYNTTILPIITQNNSVPTNRPLDNLISSVITQIPSSLDNIPNITDQTLNITENPTNPNNVTLSSEGVVVTVVHNTEHPLNNVTTSNKYSNVITNSSAISPSDHTAKPGNANRLIPHWTIFISITVTIFCGTKVSLV